MTDDLSKGVPYNEGWRFVQATDPALVEALDEARKAYDQNELAWHERNTEYQITSGSQRRRVPSPYSKALREAEAAVIEKFEELVASGQVVYAGFPNGQLEGDPKPIPSALRPRVRGRETCVVRGVKFHDVRLYPAEAIKGLGAWREKAELETETAPRAKSILTEQDCFDDLVKILRSEPNKRSAKPRVLLRLLMERNPAYGTVKESDTVKGWIRNQKDDAAEKAAGTG